MNGCAFDLEHYRVLLDSAKDGGYTFSFFDHEPRAGDVFVRHDVDLSLEAALTLAELESDEDARWVTASASTPSGLARSSTSASTRSSPGTTPTRGT